MRDKQQGMATEDLNNDMSFAILPVTHHASLVTFR